MLQRDRGRHEGWKGGKGGLPRCFLRRRLCRGGSTGWISWIEARGPLARMEMMNGELQGRKAGSFPASVAGWLAGRFRGVEKS